MTQQLLSLFLSLLTLLSALPADIAGQTSLGGNLMLVNREYLLPESYEPQQLTMPKVKRSTDSVLLRPEAAEALEALFEAAKQEEGYTLIAVSGYRSYSTQALIYNRKIKRTGSGQKAQRLVAPPGASEHQTGLAMDVKSNHYQNLSAGFAKTKEGIWLAENCWRFGFIIRYKAEWEDITGYAFEPWHIRYVGKEHAKLITDLNIPFETYIALLRTLQDSQERKEVQ